MEYTQISFSFFFSYSRDKWAQFCDNDEIKNLLKTEFTHRLVVCSWHFQPSELIGDGRSRLAFNGLVPHLRPPHPRNHSPHPGNLATGNEDHAVESTSETSPATIYAEYDYCICLCSKFYLKFFQWSTASFCSKAKRSCLKNCQCRCRSFSKFA